jgi:predicted lipoprotein with Yx(FWY)xxD motif
MSLLFGLSLQCGVGAQAQSEEEPKSPQAKLPYPAEVALLKTSKGWTFRQAPTSMPLYRSNHDQAGRSHCYDGCASQWIPLEAPKDAKALGEWSVIKRKGGERQWAFRGRPVYLHVHDSPDAAVGDGEGGAWHVLPYFH